MRAPFSLIVLVELVIAVTLGRAHALVQSDAVADSAHHGVHQSQRAVEDVDVLVYGSTPSGVAAAVAASRAGRTAAIVDPSLHVGGMVTGGLSCSDTGNASAIGACIASITLASLHLLNMALNSDPPCCSADEFVPCFSA